MCTQTPPWITGTSELGLPSRMPVVSKSQSCAGVCTTHVPSGLLVAGVPLLRRAGHAVEREQARVVSLTAQCMLSPAAAVLPPPNRLCIDNLFEKRWDPISGAYSEANLKFKKMPLGEAAPQTGDQRRRQVRRRAGVGFRMLM